LKSFQNVLSISTDFHLCIAALALNVKIEQGQDRGTGGLSPRVCGSAGIFMYLEIFGCKEFPCTIHRNTEIGITFTPSQPSPRPVLKLTVAEGNSFALGLNTDIPYPGTKKLTITDWPPFLLNDGEYKNLKIEVLHETTTLVHYNPEVCFYGDINWQVKSNPNFANGVAPSIMAVAILFLITFLYN